MTVAQKLEVAMYKAPRPLKQVNTLLGSETNNDAMATQGTHVDERLQPIALDSQRFTHACPCNLPVVLCESRSNSLYRTISRTRRYPASPQAPDESHPVRAATRNA